MRDATDLLRAKRRAYYEANRDEIAAKQRAYGMKLARLADSDLVDWFGVEIMVDQAMAGGEKWSGCQLCDRVAAARELVVSRQGLSPSRVARLAGFNSWTMAGLVSVWTAPRTGGL